jgi:hypothetical protein
MLAAMIVRRFTARLQSDDLQDLPESITAEPR